ncbi:hypothetical protein [Bacteroides sp.]|uniref:hypothetical protein n=1 Tax=Bacteroides sp. TaxID=29523 RepID=UPI002628EE08|nr:hypothetical protein [Bacteroides sp.]MDD3040053.1 hypothetical protein [Bacteroides sp.]
MNEEKEEIKVTRKDTIITVGVITISAVIGYKLGYARSNSLAVRGLEKICDFDPSLYDHIRKSMLEYKKSQK